MGSVSLKTGEGSVRFRRATLWSSALNLLMLSSLLFTNLFALYAFTSPPLHSHHHQHLRHPSGFQSSTNNFSLISEQVSLILREIHYSQRQLSQLQKQLLGFNSLDLSLPSVPSELRSFLLPHPLPLGPDSRSALTHLSSSVSHSCSSSLSHLSLFMSYTPSHPCPDDQPLLHHLLSSLCDPLPRRRCFSRPTPRRSLLLPLPSSLWSPVSDKIPSWRGSPCSSFACLNPKLRLPFFDLSAERHRWIRARSKLDFVIDDVLAMARLPLHTGLDLGGDSGTFAARMYDRGLTVVTSVLNADAPFNEFLAARGLFPLFLSPEQRLPFDDGVFDLVRTSLAGLRDLGRPQKMEFVLFDVDRVLRVGGLFWLDNFHCIDEERKKGITRLIERFGYRKLRWVVGEKAENGSSIAKSQVYLSAVLQKPTRGG